MGLALSMSSGEGPDRLKPNFATRVMDCYCNCTLFTKSELNSIIEMCWIEEKHMKMTQLKVFRSRRHLAFLAVILELQYRSYNGSALEYDLS